MFRNYYKIAIRHIVRSRLHSLINVVGLSTGITLLLLIGVYCWSEWQPRSLMGINISGKVFRWAIAPC